MNPISLTVRPIVEATKIIEAEVLFTSSPIAFLQGVDPEKGIVSDKKSEIFGKEFHGKVLVFPNAVGSSVGAYVIYRLKKNRKAPLAMINRVSDIITASGCALAAIPLYDVETGSFESLKTHRKITIENKKGTVLLQ
jgi:uncharacterized protein